MKIYILLIPFIFNLLATGNKAYATPAVDSCTSYVDLDESNNDPPFYTTPAAAEPKKQIQIVSWVIGFVASQVLSNAVTEVCVEMGGNRNLCEAVVEAISLITSIETGGYRRGRTKAIGWQVAKGKNLSYLTFESEESQTSAIMKKLLAQYAKDCAENFVWQKLMEADPSKLNIDPVNGVLYKRLYVRNYTGSDLIYYGSLNGDKWLQASTGIRTRYTGGLFDTGDFDPIQFNYKTEPSLPYYFNDGVYIKFFNGNAWTEQYVYWGTKYIFEISNGIIILHSA
jgi:hypothetical protein